MIDLNLCKKYRSQSKLENTKIINLLLIDALVIKKLKNVVETSYLTYPWYLLEIPKVNCVCKLYGILLWESCFHYFPFQIGGRIHIPTDFRDTKVVVTAQSKEDLETVIEMVKLHCYGYFFSYDFNFSFVETMVQGQSCLTMVFTWGIRYKDWQYVMIRGNQRVCYDCKKKSNCSVAKVKVICRKINLFKAIVTARCGLANFKCNSWTRVRSC